MSAVKRLLERRAEMGDARWRRTHYPTWLFIIANPWLMIERLFRLKWGD
jgi:hypothetical protein